MLSQAAEQYIRLRRIGGFKFDIPARLVQSFARFATARGDSRIETQTVIDWAAQSPSPEAREVRLQVIIAFARHCHAEDVTHDVPRAGVFGKGYSRRPIAYIFSPEEIERLLAAALTLQPKASLRPFTFHVLFGLLAATGLRLGEALRLRFDDLTAEGLLIRETKFRKSRLVPLHPTTTQVLQRYVKLRTLLGGDDGHVFIGLNGRRLRSGTVQTTFREVASTVGLDDVPRKRRPRLHDLRHTWAVRALESSPRDVGLVDRHMRAVTTYLGHAKVASGYWYLHATPFLMKRIADACAAREQEAP
jgi:integrase/recombinase XerD